MKLNIQLFASVKTATHDGRYLKLTVTETATDVVANTSTVHWVLESTGGKSSYYTIYKYGAYVNGSQVYDGNSGDKTMNWDVKKFPAKTGSVSGDVTIYHNEDGSASNISFSLHGKVSSSGTATFDGTLALTQLQRGSKLDSFSTSNSTATFGYTKYVSSFYDRITFTSNGQTLATIDNPNVNAGTYTNQTASYNMSAVLAASTAAQNKTITITATLKTYTDSSYTTQVGETITKTDDATLGSSTLNSISSMIIYSDGYATFNPSITRWFYNTYDCIEVSGGTFSQTFNNVSDGGTNVFNSANLFAAMGNNDSLTLNFKLITYSSNGGAYLGDSSIDNQTISLPTYSINASVSEYDDLNKSTSPGSMGHYISYYKPGNSTMIRYLSNPQITYQVASSTGYLYGNSISTSGAKVVSGLGHNSTFTVEPGTDMVSSYSIVATDGRKTSSAATQSFTVVPYFMPTITVKFVRTAPTASTATATVSVSYYNDSGNLLTNKETLSTLNSTILTYTESGGSAVTKGYSDTTPTSSTSGDTTTLTFTYSITGLNYQKSIAVSAQFKDLIGYTVSTNVNVPNGLPAINAYRYNDKNYVKVNGDEIISGDVKVNGDETIDGDLGVNGDLSVNKVIYGGATIQAQNPSGETDIICKDTNGNFIYIYAHNSGHGMYDNVHGALFSVYNGGKHLEGDWIVDGSIKSKNACCYWTNQSITWSTNWEWQKMVWGGITYNNTNIFIDGNEFYIPANVSIVKVSLSISFYNIDIQSSDKNFAVYKNGSYYNQLAYVQYNSVNNAYVNVTGFAYVSVAQNDHLSIWVNSGSAGTMRVFESTKVLIEIIA